MTAVTERLRTLEHLTGEEWDGIVSRAGGLMDSRVFSCAESMMLAFQETLGKGLLPPASVSLAGAFGGGLGGGGCLCGALAAGEMILGAVLGYEGDATGEPSGTAKRARILYKELHDHFRETNHATCCRVLTKNLEWNSPERKEHCRRMVENSATFTANILARESAAPAAVGNLTP